MLFPDVVIVTVESDPSAEVSVHEVSWLGQNLKSVGRDRGEKRGAVPSSNTNVIRVDRERY